MWIEESGSYTVSYLLDRPGYSCRAFVFNTSGLRVADISNHELLGISGKITWSGVANNGSPLQTGVYIFYAEIYHPEGTVKRFKKAFLIRDRGFIHKLPYTSRLFVYTIRAFWVEILAERKVQAAIAFDRQRISYGGVVDLGVWAL